MLRLVLASTVRASCRFKPQSRRLLVARQLHTTRTMARKSARALAAAEAPHEPTDEAASSSKASLYSLSPKACLTCGRVITPRAKWAKDWSGIKYCSDRCRSTRPGKIVVRCSADGAGALDECLGVTKTEAAEFKVDIETFVEGILLDVAKRNATGTLEDVQDRIKDILNIASIDIGSLAKETSVSQSDQNDEEQKSAETNDSMHPLWKAMDSPPGLRERIRRAARRLALGLTHDSDPQQTNTTTTDAGSIELLQNAKVLRTIQDLSFAKGVLHIKLKHKP